MTVSRHVVMAGPVLAIHVLKEEREVVDARHKAGHDGLDVATFPASGER
jgi:hypothetical protein